MNKLERALHKTGKHNERSVKAACKESAKLGGVWVPATLKCVDTVTSAKMTRHQAT